MNILIDLAGVFLVVVNVLLGLRYGLLRRLFVLVGVYAGVAIATFSGNALVSWFYGTGRTGSLYADAWSFLAVVAVVTAGAELLGALYSDRLRAVATLMFDRTVAAGVGALLGVVQIALVCFVGLSAASANLPKDGTAALPGDQAALSDSIKASVFGGRVYGAGGSVQSVFRLVLPSDLPAHLADSSKRDLPARASK